MSHRMPRRSLRRLSTFALTGAVVAGTALPAQAAAERPGPRPSPGDTISALRSDLADYLSARGTAEHISADAVTITFPGGTPAISLAAGSQTYGGTTPVSAFAPWQIGSNTKAFTSVVLLQLEAEGRLSIGDRLGKWLPQYPEWKDVTIRQLLDMTSGIPDYTIQPDFLEAVESNLDASFSAPQLVGYVYGKSLGSAGYAYTNTDYILAQMVIEAATHHTFADELTRRILHPLGLRHTCLAPETCAPSTAAAMATGYFLGDGTSPFAGTPVPALGLSWAQGAGGIVATLPDLAVWDRALYQGCLLPPRQQRELESLISTTSGKPIRTTTLDDPLGYGLGVAQVTTPPTGTVWYYGGETFGARVLHIFDPRTGVLIIVSANSNATDDDLFELAVAVLQTLQTGHKSAATPTTVTPATHAS